VAVLLLILGVWLLPALASVGRFAVAVLGVVRLAARRADDVRVALEVAGTEPPDTAELARAVATELGEPVELLHRWRFGDQAPAVP
jgi:hypothetical protein